MTTLAGPAGTLHVEDGGSGGTPVLFLHSFAGSAAHWSAQLNHLRLQRRALALDLRGHGESGPPADGDYAIESLADDVAAVADALGLSRLELVGHSIGGSAAIAYARAHADRVSSLLLVGTPGRTPPEQSRAIMKAMKADYQRVTQDYWSKLLAGSAADVRAWITGEMNAMPKETALAIVEAAFAYDPIPDLTRFAGPVLSITTSHGEGPNDLKHALPGLPQRRIDGTSHWPHMDRPQEFNRVMDDFLTRTSDVETASSHRS